MEKDIRTIWRANDLGKVDEIEPILSGQNNAVALVNDEYVVRIARREEEKLLEKEAFVVEAVHDSVKTYEIILFDTEHQVIKKDYMVTKKIEGVNLAHLWLDLSYVDRGIIIQQLCEELKNLHTYNESDLKELQDRNWQQEISGTIEKYFDKVKKIGNIPGDAFDNLQDYYYKNKHLLNEPCRVGLIHDDIHFENVIVNDMKVTALLDFEFARIGPIDHELMKIVDALQSPMNYVPEELEGAYIGKNYLEYISLFKFYYPELFEADQIVERVKLYLIREVLWGYIAANDYGNSQEALRKCDERFRDYFMRDILWEYFY